MSKEQYDRDEVVGKNRYIQQANKVWWIISNGEKVLVSDDVRSVSDDPDGSDFFISIDNFEEELAYLMADAFAEFS